MDDNINFIDEKIQTTIDKINICWKEILTNNIKDGMKNLNIIFDNIEYIINTLSIANKDLNINSILSIFAKIENSLVVKDYICVADLLKYDVQSILIKWNKKLK